MTAKIMRFDTGDIVGTFAVEASGIENGSGYAEKRLLKLWQFRQPKRLRKNLKRLVPMSIPVYR